MRKRTWKEVSGPGVNLTQSQDAVGDRDTDCGERVGRVTVEVVSEVEMATGMLALVILANGVGDIDEYL